MKTIQLSKNVSLVCHIGIGDTVMFDDDYDPKYKGKKTEVVDVKLNMGGCSSGFLVKTKIYKDYVDSGWLNKVNPEIEYEIEIREK